MLAPGMRLGILPCYPVRHDCRGLTEIPILTYYVGAIVRTVPVLTQIMNGAFRLISYEFLCSYGNVKL